MAPVKNGDYFTYITSFDPAGGLPLGTGQPAKKML